MVAQAGRNVLLKVGDAGDPEVFTTVGGLENTTIVLNRSLVDVTNVSSGGWRELLDGGERKSMRIAGDGKFTDSTSEATVRQLSFTGDICNYKLHFGNGDKISCALQISLYERRAEVDEEETFAIALESSGMIVYTSAA